MKHLADEYKVVVSSPNPRDTFCYSPGILKLESGRMIATMDFGGSGICAFRIGVGRGVIRHIRVSNISIKQCLNIAQFCTSYNANGCANIEDVNFSNISAQNTDRCFDAFAKNGAYIRNITLENIRTSATVVNQIICYDGRIDNFNVRNLELAFADKKKELSAEGLVKQNCNF